MREPSVNWKEVVGDINIDLLLSIDVNNLKLLNEIPSFDKLDGSAINTIYSVYSARFATPIFKLEDLDRIDWDAVATEVRSLTDLWGQVVKPIVDAVSGFVDGLKKAFERLVEPVRRYVEDIWRVVSGIPSALARLADMLRGVVVDPIVNALRFVSENFPKIIGMFREYTSSVVSAFGELMNLLGRVSSRVVDVFSDLVERVRGGFSWFLEQVSKFPDIVSGLVGRVTEIFSGLADRIRSGFSWFLEQIAKFPDVVRDLVGRVAGIFSDLAERIRGGFSWFLEQVGKLPDIVKSLVDKVAELFSGLASRVREGFSWFLEQVGKIPDFVRDLIGKTATLFGELAERIRGGFAWFIDQVGKLPDVVRGFIGRVAELFGELAERIRRGFQWFVDQVSRLPDVVRDLVGRVAGLFSDLADRIRSGFSWFLEQAGRLPDVVRDLVVRVAADFSELARRVREGFAWFIDKVRELPDVVRGVVEAVRRHFGELAKAGEELFKRVSSFIASVGEEASKAVWRVIGDVREGIGGVVEWIRRGFDAVAKSFSDALERLRAWVEQASRAIGGLGVAFQGFVNAFLKIPEALGAVFKPVSDFFMRIWEEVQAFARDPLTWFRTRVVEPLWAALVFVGGKVWEGLQVLGGLVMKGFGWLYDRLREGVEWLKDRVVDAGKWLASAFRDVATKLTAWFEELLSPFFEKSSPLKLAPFVKVAPDVEEAFVSALKRTAGVGENLWRLGGELAIPFWKSVTLLLVLRGLANMVGNLEVWIEPAFAGSKGGGFRWTVKLQEFVDAMVRAFEIFSSGYAMGMSMALANTLMVNLQPLYTPRVVAYYDEKVREILEGILTEDEKKYAKINMFLKTVSESALIDYARRMLALSQGLKDEKRLKEVLATISAHLKLYGLPKWYIEFLTAHPEQVKVPFIDRFGVERKIYLSHIFELPTHSELARMTQRDIFPGVDVMKRVAWVRGWNEDLTTMIYLLTFKYPSFEKLWTFYMRALSGMLWFEPPETIRKVFEAEAKEVGAGKPISALAIQKALTGPDQVKAMELALNTYFKWIEYSNFSWFTEKTEMYGIPIGREIYSKLGGWTADSWIMVDIAADLPTKIDLRWMSRYGLFIHMAKKFEEAGVKFESYTPLVEAVPKLLESSAATPIQVDLRWFSKLLQATGLHPAWVPIVTVAENIMAIADEMTLLRTGWLNLFKEGMITIEDAERYLAGLLTVSYLVGYWDPVAKVWTSGWINLPVRWLPHERRLLQLRMAMDRILDLYRETYSYIKSGIRTLAITVDDAFKRLKALVEALNVHYKRLTKAITGVEMEVKVDEEYAKLWLELQALAQDIEAVERVRIWWSRVSGWILYRVAYGWVTEEEIDKLIETVSKFIPLHEVEVEAYKAIAKAMLGIARKEAVPSPSTLAAFAEYMVIDTKTIDDVLRKYNVPEEYWKLWTTYISVKPVKSDYRAVINTALKALRYGAITKEDWERILKVAENYGFTPVELSLLQMRAELELVIDEARLWRPTLLTLISMIEYVPEAKELIKFYKIDPMFRPIIEKYAYVKPLVDEFKPLLNLYYKVYMWFKVPDVIVKTINEYAKLLGFTEEELRLRHFRSWLDWLEDLWREWRLTPARIAMLAEYMPIDIEIIDRYLRFAPIDEDEKAMWIKYIRLRPIKPDYKAVISTALRALRYRAITEDEWKKILEDARKYGFTDPEIALLQLRAELERAIEEAREYVPTPSMLATLAEYLPEVRKYIAQVFEARRIRGAWAEVWAKYIYLRPVVDEVRRWASAMFRLAEYAMIDIKQLDDVFKILKTYGWEDLEIAIIQKTIGANLVYHAFNYIIGSPRALAGMARYTDKAADMAYARAIRLIDALPVDQNTKNLLKEMWKEYIMSYQAQPEISRYITELINAYAYGVLDDKGLDQELDYLRKLGVPEMRLALVRRTAQLRRARVVARYRS